MNLFSNVFIFKTKHHSLRVFLLGDQDRGQKSWGLAPKGINLNFLQNQPSLLIYSRILVKILAKGGGQKSPYSLAKFWMRG